MAKIPKGDFGRRKISLGWLEEDLIRFGIIGNVALIGKRGKEFSFIGKRRRR